MEAIFTILKLPDLFGHIIAFLILFFVLKKFLWGTILGTIDDRQKSIEYAYQEVEEEKRRAMLSRAELEERLAKISEEGRKKMEEAAREARKLAEEIRAQAEAERDRILARAQAEIEREREKLMAQLNNYVADLSIDIAEKLLREKLDREEHRKLVKVLTKDL